MGGCCSKRGIGVAARLDISLDSVFDHYDSGKNGYWVFKDFSTFSDELLGNKDQRKQRNYWVQMLRFVNDDFINPAKRADIAFARLSREQFRTFLTLSQDQTFIFRLKLAFVRMMTPARFNAPMVSSGMMNNMERRGKSSGYDSDDAMDDAMEASSKNSKSHSLKTDNYKANSDSEEADSHRAEKEMEHRWKPVRWESTKPLSSNPSSGVDPTQHPQPESEPSDRGSTMVSNDSKIHKRRTKQGSTFKRTEQNLRRTGEFPRDGKVRETERESLSHHGGENNSYYDDDEDFDEEEYEDDEGDYDEDQDDYESKTEQVNGVDRAKSSVQRDMKSRSSRGRTVSIPPSSHAKPTNAPSVSSPSIHEVDLQFTVSEEDLDKYKQTDMQIKEEEELEFPVRVKKLITKLGRRFFEVRWLTVFEGDIFYARDMEDASDAKLLELVKDKLIKKKENGEKKLYDPLTQIRWIPKDRLIDVIGKDDYILIVTKVGKKQKNLILEPISASADILLDTLLQLSTHYWNNNR